MGKVKMINRTWNLNKISVSSNPLTMEVISYGKIGRREEQEIKYAVEYYFSRGTWRKRLD